jgi:2'-5' RNA ligase
MPRLFTGLEIPPEIGAELSRYRGGLPGARWVEPANYHVTLRFIGDVDEAVAADIYAALEETRPRAAIPIEIDGLASFGGERPHAVFAAVTPSAALSELQAEHEALARRVGLPPDKRKFHPHVTLARLRHVSSLDVADFLGLHGGGPRLAFTARRVALYSARESTGGGPYVVEAAYPLS